jgi:DNA-binding transcriptional LysR family regulator
MIELKDIRLIQAVAEHGTLVRAARVLGISQPNLTRSLAALEARLNGPLFERHCHGVIATNLARTVLAEAPGILAQIGRLERMLTDVRGNQDTELRIATGLYIGETIGYRAAARMTVLHPKVQLRLSPGDWLEVPRALHAREASIGLLDVRGHEADPSLVIEPLTPQPGVFVVRRGHPLTQRASLSLPDILAFPFFFIDRVPQQVHAQLVSAREAARHAGNAHPAFPALLFQTPTAALEQLRHCDAVMGVTPQIGGAALRSGEVVPLRWREPWLSLCPAFVRRRSQPMSEAERAYVQLLHETSRLIGQETQAWFRDLGLSTDCDPVSA